MKVQHRLSSERIENLDESMLQVVTRPQTRELNPNFKLDGTMLTSGAARNPYGKDPATGTTAASRFARATPKVYANCGSWWCWRVCCCLSDVGCIRRAVYDVHVRGVGRVDSEP